MRLSHIIPSVGFGLFLAGSAMAQSAGDCEVTAEGMFTGLLAATKQSAQVCADERTKQQGGPSASPAPSNASADRPFDAGEQAAINAVVECAKKKPDEVVALVRNTARTNGGNIPAAIESQRKSYCRAPVNSIVQENNNGAFAAGGAAVAAPVVTQSLDSSNNNFQALTAALIAQQQASAVANSDATSAALAMQRQEIGPAKYHLWNSGGIPGSMIYEPMTRFNLWFTGGWRHAFGAHAANTANEAGRFGLDAGLRLFGPLVLQAALEFDISGEEFNEFAKQPIARDFRVLGKFGLGPNFLRHAFNVHLRGGYLPRIYGGGTLHTAYASVTHDFTYLYRRLALEARVEFPLTDKGALARLPDLLIVVKVVMPKIGGYN